MDVGAVREMLLQVFVLVPLAVPDPVTQSSGSCRSGEPVLPQSGASEQLLGRNSSSHQCRDELNPVILSAALHIFCRNVSCQETVMCVFLYKEVFVL